MRGVRATMKLRRDAYVLWICVASVSTLLAGCAALLPMRAPSSEMRAEVAFSSQGTPEGRYTLYDSVGRVQARGEFQDGLRHGVWSFWDTGGTKLIEITYRNGVKEGPCRMWYGSFAFPHSAGTRKLEVDFSGDRQKGMKRTWWPGGNRKCETALDAGSVLSARCWRESGAELTRAKALEVARDQLEADRRYLRTLDEVVEDSLKLLSLRRRSRGAARLTATARD